MRERAKKKKTGWLPRVLAGIVILGVVTVTGGWFAVKIWLKNYLAGDECRDLIARQIGNAAHAECVLDPLSWSGPGVYSAKAILTPAVKSSWKKIEADGLQAVLDWDGVRRGVWSVPVINIDWLHIDLSAAEKAGSTTLLNAASNIAEKTEGPASPPPAPGWLRRWIPTRTEIGEVKAERFDLKPAAPGDGIALDGVTLKAKPAADEGAWHVRGSGGTVVLPGTSTPFRLTSATARVDARTLSLVDAVASWIGESGVTSRGEYGFGGGKPWSFSGRVNNLEVRHLLSDAWKGKLSGVMDGGYEASAKPGAAVLLKGSLRVKGGVVQGLPLLDRVADFTHTERFRRVVLDEAAADYERQGGRLRITRIVLQSNGLIRVEGDVFIEGGVIDGNLLVGVSPETLRWMPGAQNHVFTEPHPGGGPGFVWTHVRVSGTSDAPREDLSNRLLAAAGKAVLVDAPMEVLGMGLNVIEKAGPVIPGEKNLIDSGRGMIKDAGDAAGKGVDLLKGAIPFLPK